MKNYDRDHGSCRIDISSDEMKKIIISLIKIIFVWGWL